MMIVFQYYCNTIYNSIRLYYNLESHTKWKDTDSEMSVFLHSKSALEMKGQE